MGIQKSVTLHFWHKMCKSGIFATHQRFFKRFVAIKPDNLQMIEYFELILAALRPAKKAFFEMPTGKFKCK